MTHREQYLAAVEALLGMPVLWGAKGPDAYDCSGVVTASMKKIGGPDLTDIENSQALHDHSRALGWGPKNLLEYVKATGLDGHPLQKPLPGDLAFYGYSMDRIVHVATVDQYGGAISADGATSQITSLHIALANPSHRVRRHAKVDFRGDLPFWTVHRFVALDELDRVSR